MAAVSRPAERKKCARALGGFSPIPIVPFILFLRPIPYSHTRHPQEINIPQTAQTMNFWVRHGPLTALGPRCMPTGHPLPSQWAWVSASKAVVYLHNVSLEFTRWRTDRSDTAADDSVAAGSLMSSSCLRLSRPISWSLAHRLTTLWCLLADQ